MRPFTDMTYRSPEHFCAEIRATLVGSLTMFCGNRGLAEEFAQEALARAFERWDELDTPRAWIYATAFNLARSRFRRIAAERRARDRIAVLSGREGTVEPDIASAIAVRLAVAGLAERQRLAIACRFYAQMSVREAAQAMGCAEGTVKALTSQAIANLRANGLAIDPTNEEVTTRA